MLAEWAAQAAASKQERIRDNIAKIPSHYRETDFNNATVIAERVKDRRAIDLARTALGTYTAIVFLGPTRIGKSSLAGAILRQAAERGRSVCWAPALRLARARAESRLGAEPEEIRDALRAGVTCIDDLGQEPITTLSSDVIDLVHERHDHDRPLVVTSGFSRQELGTKYGGSVVARLLEKGLVIDLRANP